MNESVSRRLAALEARLDTPAGWDQVRKAAWAVLAAALLAFVVRGATKPDDPYFAGDAREPIPGFEEISFTVTDASGAMAEWCAMLAETDEQHAQGLMRQPDLRGYDGMVFRYPQPKDGAFWMRNTIIPLAVAFFGPDGRFVSAAGMDPCPDDVVDCPLYPAAAPFQFAIEVPRGGLGRLGIGEGSTVAFPGTPCSA